MKQALQYLQKSLAAFPDSLPVVVIDVGARNGPTETRSIDALAATYCFEPNPAEFAKLAGIGVSKGGPGSLQVYPTAVTAQGGETTLNIVRRPGGSSTLIPNRAVLEHFAADNWSQISEIVERVAVPAVRMAEFMQQAGLSHIDFLKLDTQGNELDILQSLDGFIDTVSVVKVEVEFLQLYEGQPLYHHVAAFMHKHGFELIDIEAVPATRRFHRFANLRPSAYRLVWADMIFCRVPTDPSDPRAIAKAIVLGSLGYADLASYVFELATHSDAALQQEFDAFCLAQLKPRTTAARIRNFVERVLGLLMIRYDWRRGQQVRSAK